MGLSCVWSCSAGAHACPVAGHCGVLGAVCMYGYACGAAWLAPGSHGVLAASLCVAHTCRQARLLGCPAFHAHTCCLRHPYLWQADAEIHLLDACRSGRQQQGRQQQSLPRRRSSLQQRWAAAARQQAAATPLPGGARRLRAEQRGGVDDGSRRGLLAGSRRGHVCMRVWCGIHGVLAPGNVSQCRVKPVVACTVSSQGTCQTCGTDGVHTLPDERHVCTVPYSSVAGSEADFSRKSLLPVHHQETARRTC